MSFLTFDPEMKILVLKVLANEKLVGFSSNSGTRQLIKKFHSEDLTEQQRTDFNYFYKQLS